MVKPGLIEGLIMPGKLGVIPGVIPGVMPGVIPGVRVDIPVPGTKLYPGVVA
jgi:hypothetical protein